MRARESAVVLHSTIDSTYGVRVREMRWHRLWWGPWRSVSSGYRPSDVAAFRRDIARALADNALEHGWAINEYGHAEPLIGKESE